MFKIGSLKVCCPLMYSKFKLNYVKGVVKVDDNLHLYQTK